MAKDSGISKNTPIKLTVGLLIIIGGGLVWVASGISNHNAEGKAISLKVEKLDEDGSKPAKKNTLGLALVEKDINTIQSDVSDLKAAQEVGFKEILRRLPK